MGICQLCDEDMSGEDAVCRECQAKIDFERQARLVVATKRIAALEAEQERLDRVVHEEGDDAGTVDATLVLLDAKDERITALEKAVAAGRRYYDTKRAWEKERRCPRQEEARALIRAGRAEIGFMEALAVLDREGDD